MGGSKKKWLLGCLVVPLSLMGLIVVISIIIAVTNGGDTENGASGDKPPASASSDAPANNKEQKSNGHEELYATAQAQDAEGKYLDALANVDKAIAGESKEEYLALKSNLESKIAARKSELESMFEIKEDKVENITFISPKSPISQGLIFYPYIGIKDAQKYMLLRVGFQEEASKALFVFSGIKIRAGESLEELKFSPLDKMNNVDLLGSGMTEVVDISVKSKEEKLLAETIPNTEEVIVRFEDFSNKTSDYTLNDEQRKNISAILEYYSFLE